MSLVGAGAAFSNTAYVQELYRNDLTYRHSFFTKR